MNDRNRKEMMLVLLLATACGGNAVDLGQGGGSGWIDVGEQGDELTEPQTIFQRKDIQVYAIAADESTLFALVGDNSSVELVSCPISSCGSQRSVLYRSMQGDRTSVWLTPIVSVGDYLFWKLSNGDPLGVASCSKAGCETPIFVPLDIFSGDHSSLAADESGVFVMDFNGSLLRLTPGAASPTVIRKGAERTVSGPPVPSGSLVAAGDFVHFAAEHDQAVYRVKKDGSADPELVAKGQQITGLAATESSVYYSTQILDGSIVECPLGGLGCVGKPLVSKQRWPAGVRVDGQQLFWANGFSTDAASQGPNTTPASLWSCDLPDCSAPRERVRELFFPSISGGSAGSLQPGTFTFSRDFVLWLEETAGTVRIRKLRR